MAPIVPPFVELTDHVAFTSGSPLFSAENWKGMPAGTVVSVGETVSPVVDVPTVTTAVLDVTSPVVVVEVFVTLVLVLVSCSATAVIFTAPLFVEGTAAGAR